MVTIRAAEGSDLETARVLLREYAAYLSEAVGAEHLCLENYEKELGSLPRPYHAPDGVILLALTECETATGIVALKPLTPMRTEHMQRMYPEERAGEVKRFWVRPEFRGRKIGEALTRRVMDEARTRGYNALYLDTMPSVMAAACRIYAQAGFTPVEAYQESNPVLKGGYAAVPDGIPGCEDNRAPGVVFYRCGL